MRRTSGIAAALMAMLGLATPALASTQTVLNTTSTSYAGYFDTTSTGNWTISATLIVPKVTCTAGENAEITPAIGVESSYGAGHVGVIIGCSSGKATYESVVELHGYTLNTSSDVPHPGDTIKLKMTQGYGSGDDALIVDETHKFKVNPKSSGTEACKDPWAGDLARSLNNVEMGVPAFGTLHFSSVVMNGAPFGSATSLTGYNRVTSTGTVQIATSAFASNKEAFTTTFKHS